MTLAFDAVIEDNTVEISIRGKLEKSDYNIFVPELNRLIQEHGKINILVDMQEFEGFSIGALWEDVKFDINHFSDIERVAVVGDSRLEKAATAFFKPFTRAEVRYFDGNQRSKAENWVRNKTDN